MSRFHQIKSYIGHWLDTVDHHSVHSPFYYDFYNKVLKGTGGGEGQDAIEKLRLHLLENQTMVDVLDLGSGSTAFNGPRRALKDIARTSLSPAHVAQLMYRICYHAEVRKIVELGTSLGLTSLYLSYVPQANVYTFEGSHALANVAMTNFEFLERRNIDVVEGDIAHTLPEFLQQDTAKIGFALVDANHRLVPTLTYYETLMKRFDEKSIMVIDDIHRSPEMEAAWKQLRNHDLVYGSIDIYHCGILLFEPTLTRQHYVWSL